MMAIHTTCLVDGNTMKRIAVTCKCGNRFVEEVPAEVFKGGAKPILTCDICKQAYVILDGKIRRFDNGMLGKELPKKELNAPVDAEFSEKEPELKDKAAWEMPGSSLVN